MGNYVLLNLFLAVLLNGFSMNADKEELMEYNDLYLKKAQLPQVSTASKVQLLKAGLVHRPGQTLLLLAENRIPLLREH